MAALLATGAAAQDRVAGGGSEAATLPYLYSFGSGSLGRPIDVAVFGPAGASKYVFVTDALGVVRFNGQGAGVGVRVYSGSVTGIAVNDTEGHCRFGEVYVGTNSPAKVVVMDTSGGLISEFTNAGNFTTITGVACGFDGTVYVADRGSNATYVFYVSSLPPASTSGILPADITLTGSPLPLDVAVDQSNVVSVSCVNGEIWRYPPGGPFALCNTLGTTELRGIDASDPCGRVWVTQAATPTIQRYLGCAADRTAVGPTLVPWGVEYDRFLSGKLGSPPSITLKCRERLYVCEQTINPILYQVDVYGEDHDSASLPVGAVAWWRLDEIQPDCGGPPLVVDDVYGNVNGTAVGGPLSKEGMVWRGYEFGAGSHVVVPANPLLDFGTGDFTIEGWVQTTQATGLQTILDKRVGVGAGYHIYISGGVLGIQLNDGNFQNLSAGPSIADGKWHHYAFVVDRTANTCTGYVDCVASPAAAITLTGSFNSTGPLYIGVRNYPTADLAGRLDELTMYSRTLSAAEIASIWTAGCAGKALPFRPPTPYCASGISANGCQPVMSALGVASASEASGFSLSVSNVEGQKNGLFFFGTNGQQANPWGNGTSFQCVVPPVSRGGLQSSGGTNGGCDGVFAEDLNALWCPTCPKSAKNPGIGAIVQAQLWYRDPGNGSNQSTSLSNAIEFEVSY